MTVIWGSSRSDRGAHGLREWVRGIRHRASLDGRTFTPPKVRPAVEFSEHAHVLETLRQLHQSFGASSADTPSLLLPAVGAPMFSGQSMPGCDELPDATPNPRRLTRTH